MQERVVGVNASLGATEAAELFSGQAPDGTPDELEKSETSRSVAGSELLGCPVVSKPLPDTAGKAKVDPTDRAYQGPALCLRA
jgi:hypothetical protein